MYDLMKEHGMDLDEGCRLILEQVARKQFWVSTQPEMTEQAVAGRIEFLRTQSAPALAGEARQLLGLE
jgi:hypothetical protein